MKARSNQNRIGTALVPCARVLVLGSGMLVSAVVDAAIFQVTTTADSGPGSLRQAIVDANQTAATDDVEFQLAGAGPFTITPVTALPIITQPLRINAYTQPGALPNTTAAGSGGLNGVLMIELSGANLPNAVGLNFNSGSVVGENLVRGLVINRFAVAISRFSGAPIRVEGCYLGTDLLGATIPANIETGVSLRIAGDERVGGEAPDQRNLISGAKRSISSSGIDIFRVAGGAAPLIQGNLIGTDRTGTLALPNYDGIRFDHRMTPVTASGPLIGGATSNARNLISGNQHFAIKIACSSSGVPCSEAQISGNYFGSDVTGLLPLPNGELGVSGGVFYSNVVDAPSRVLVGGYTAGHANRFAFNNGTGVHHAGSRGTVESFRNQFHANTGRGFDLVGARPNDPADPDAGPNGLQNFPLIGAAAQVDDLLTVSYVVDSALANAAYPLTIQFYRSNGEANATYIGEDTYAAAEAMQIKQAQIALLPGAEPLTRISAFATDSVGNTSELSDEFVVVPQLFMDGFEDAAR